MLTFDETTIHAQLRSESYGALMHAVEVAAAAIGADVAAGRIMEAPAATLDSYVSTTGLTLKPKQKADLLHWPRRRGSVFELLRLAAVRDGVFRPADRIKDFNNRRCDPFHEAHVAGPVRDALCMCFRINRLSWCALGFTRCNGCPFTDEAVEAMQRFKPAVTRLIRRGYDRETRAREPAPGHDGGPLALHKARDAALWTRLSPTERQVLTYLREHLTERVIAQRLDRSPHTVHVHVKNIYRKLDVGSRKQLLDLFEGPGV